MRVIAGICKGRKLLSYKGISFRPTSDRVKETVFDIIGDRIQGVSFLDLFAATGSMGIEALSRGAEKAVFVEREKRMVKLIEKNLAFCGLLRKSKVIMADVRKVLSRKILRDEKFDIIYIDPPYVMERGAEILRLIYEGELLNKEGFIIFEHFHKTVLQGDKGALRCTDERRIGGTMLGFFQIEGGEDDEKG